MVPGRPRVPNGVGRAFFAGDGRISRMERAGATRNATPKNDERKEQKRGAKGHLGESSVHNEFRKVHFLDLPVGKDVVYGCFDLFAQLQLVLDGG